MPQLRSNSEPAVIDKHAGRFLFVQDAPQKKYSKASERQSRVAFAIRQHIQKHNRRKRVTQAPVIAEAKSVVVPIGWRHVPANQPGSLPSTPQLCKTVSENSSKTDTDRPSSVSAIDAIQQCEVIQADEEESQLSCSPISILQHGNSDPFSTYTVPVTPRVNQALSFYNNHILGIPYTRFIIASRTYESVLQFRRIEIQNDRRDSIQLLEDHFCGKGFLLAQLTILATNSSDRQTKSDVVHLKQELYQSLQARIEHRYQIDEIMIECVFQLFHSAALGGDRTEALVHGRCLVRLIKDYQSRRGCLPGGIVLLFRLAYIDIGLSATYAVQSIFNDSQWITRAFTNELEDIASRNEFDLQPLAAATDHFNSDIPEILRPILTGCQRALWMWWICPSLLQPDLEHSATTVASHPQACMYRWLYGQFYMYAYHLVDIIAGCHVGERCSGERQLDSSVWTLQKHTLYVLAVALLAAISGTSGKILDVKHPTRPGTMLMASRLQTAIQGAMNSLHTYGEGQINTVVLRRSICFATFIGCLLERVHNSFGTTKSLTDEFFMTNLQLNIKHLGIRYVEEVQELLRSFVYFEGVLLDEDILRQSVSV